jgi:putative addiction module killer protein
MNVISQTTVFAEWLRGLADAVGKGLIVARIEAAKLGNFGDAQPVGDGVFEMRVHFGPGYRVYYMREGRVLYLLLCGGDKSTQKTDINRARLMAKHLKEATKRDGQAEPAPSSKRAKRKPAATSRAKAPRDARKG